MIATMDEKIEELRCPRNLSSDNLSNALMEMYKLQQTTKRNEKINILKSNDKNDIFKQFFWWSQNPYLRYNIKKIKGLDKVNNFKTNNHSFIYFTGILKGLQERKWTGSAASEIVTEFFKCLCPEERDIYSRILRRNLQVGVTTKTFNSVFPNYIPTFDVMLAKEDKKVKAKPKKVILERKYDGYRVISRIENHHATMYSRNGKVYEGFNDIIKELNMLPDGVYDGELIDIKNEFSGMQHQALKKNIEKHGILNLFDYVTLDEFDNKKCKMKILNRKKRLRDKLYLSNTKTSCFQYIKYVKNTDVINYGDPKIDQYYKKLISNGYEGAMIKDVRGTYTFNRSSYWLKIVPFISVDLKIIGFNAGQPHTKYANTLGSLTFNYKGHPLDVSGIPENLRDKIWNNKDQYLGKMAEIHARQESTNKKNEKSLRFPRFIRLRPDKD